MLKNSKFGEKFQELTNSAIQGVVMSLLFAFPVLAISTDDLLLGGLATITICCATVSVIGMIPLVGWRLGVLESLNLTLVVGLAIDYIVHMAEGFHISKKKTRKEKLLEVLHETGVSAVSGAFSTLGAAVFLLFAQILFFMQFGLFVFCTVLFAIFYSMGIFVVLMALVGPETDKFSISKFFRKVRDQIFKKILKIQEKILQNSKSGEKFDTIPFEEFPEFEEFSQTTIAEITEIPIPTPISSSNQNFSNQIPSKKIPSNQIPSNKIPSNQIPTRNSPGSPNSTPSQKTPEKPTGRNYSIDDDNLSSGYESGTARLVNNHQNYNFSDFSDVETPKKLKIGNLPIAMTPIAEEGSRTGIPRLNAEEGSKPGIPRLNSASSQKKRSKSAKIYAKTSKPQVITVKELDASALSKSGNRKNHLPPLNSSQNSITFRKQIVQ